MNTNEQLFIRACKSMDSMVRLRSVYRRFYLSTHDIDVQNLEICNILTHIVDEFAPMSLSLYLREMASYKMYADVAGKKFKESDHTLYVVRDRLRQLSKEKLVELGMRVPARFRKRKLVSLYIVNSGES